MKREIVGLAPSNLSAVQVFIADPFELIVLQVASTKQRA